MTRKAILIIMDGWGHGKVEKSDAIRHARTPNVSSYYKQYPNTELITCGQAVGLPEGQMGNSEVGHLNIGAGRIVYQELERVNRAIQDGSLEKNDVLRQAFDYAKTGKKTLHLVGLVSDGGVHSHIRHLEAIIDMAKRAGVERVAVHAFTDGRDTDPHSGKGFIEELDAHCKKQGAFIATVTGRYYGMDRDSRWERVKVAYDALVRGTGVRTLHVLQEIDASYKNNVTDEFIKPIVACDHDNVPCATIQQDDAVLCFNFRTDRCREITIALTQKPFPDFQMSPMRLHYVTLTEYNKEFQNVSVIFSNDDLKNTIGEVFEQQHKKQIRIAETEKYPHVTFFFSGGREQPFEGERRIMIPSPKEVATYDQKPEMSAVGITDAILPEIEQETADFICLNFANADMVGHTGVWDAAIKAVETVDTCVGKVCDMALRHGYAVFLTADHGNSDYLINDNGTPNTAHTVNPVPFFVISNDYKGKLKPGKLGDIAPTILKYLDMPIPADMTGNVLLDA